ncbi:MAG: oligosaccharide flippase family protein [Candidatus Kariarchaeaceae archaeon]|jgi:O-antigen/teichoic acid export membrane protein
MDKKFKEKFLKGSAATSIGQASSMAIHFLSIMILTRVIPKWDFGIYALIVLIVNQLISFSGFGLDTTLVRFIASDKDEEKYTVFFKILLLRTISVLFFVLAFYLSYHIILPLFDDKIISFSSYVILFFVLGNYRDLFFTVFQGLKIFKKYAALQFISSILRLVLIIVFYSMNILDLNNLILIEIYTLVTILVVQILLIPWNKLVKRNIDAIKMRAIINFTFPIYLNNLFSSVHRRFNVFIIGALLTPVSVAYYDIGNKIPAALRRMYNSYLLVFFPNLSNLFSRGERSSGEKLINKSLIIISIFLSVGVLISFLFRNEIMTLVFSEKYAESSFVFSLLMLNLTLGALATLLGYSNLSAGYPKVPMKVNIVSSVLSLGGSLLMIPPFGYVGAAYSLIIMNTFAQLLYF